MIIHRHLSKTIANVSIETSSSTFDGFGLALDSVIAPPGKSLL